MITGDVEIRIVDHVNDGAKIITDGSPDMRSMAAINDAIEFDDEMLGVATELHYLNKDFQEDYSVYKLIDIVELLLVTIDRQTTRKMFQLGPEYSSSYVRTKHGIAVTDKRGRVQHLVNYDDITDEDTGTEIMKRIRKG